MLNKLLIKCIQSRGCSVGILGVPVNKGQPRGGVEQGPETLRKHGMITEMKKY